MPEIPQGRAQRSNRTLLINSFEGFQKKLLPKNKKNPKNFQKNLPKKPSEKYEKKIPEKNLLFLFVHLPFLPFRSLLGEESLLPAPIGWPILILVHSSPAA